MPKLDSKPSITEIITKDAKARQENCKNAIDEALKEFNCEIQVAMLISPNGNIPQLSIVAKPPTTK